MAKEIRIQKVLSDNGILSRRKAEDYIKQGRITVNGRPAHAGHAVDVTKDLIAIDGEKVSLRKKQNKIYVMLNKPRGYVTTMEDELGRKCVAQLVDDTPERVYPIGRLDKDSEGLILLTNDGDFANRVMHPSSHIGKTYRVTARPDINDEQALKLSTGVEIDGKTTLPAVVHVISKDAGRVVLQITIYEGRNRQIRKMCEAVGLEVARLRRISIGPIKLGMLKPGAWRELKPAEVIALRNAMLKVDNQQTTQSQQDKAETLKKAGYRDRDSRKNFKKTEYKGKTDDKVKTEYKGKSDYKGKTEYKGKSDYKGKTDYAGKTEYKGKSDYKGKTEYKGKSDYKGKTDYAGKTDYQNKTGANKNANNEARKDYRGNKKPVRGV